MLKKKQFKKANLMHLSNKLTKNAEKLKNLI